MPPIIDIDHKHSVFGGLWDVNLGCATKLTLVAGGGLAQSSGLSQSSEAPAKFSIAKLKISINKEVSLRKKEL
jgi:hypothetical protein